MDTKENLELCSRLKTEYYIKNIKMLYSWSNIPEHDILSHLTALGLFEYSEPIKWLLSHKSTLNVEINKNLMELPNNSRGTLEYNNILDRLKIALIVCNKNQTAKILCCVVHYSSNPKDDVNYISRF